MTRQDKLNIWADVSNIPTVQETEARIREVEGWLEERDALENSDEGRVSRGAAVLAGIFGCIGSAAVVIWLGALAWKAWISKLVDAIAFFLLLAVWLAAYAVLNPAEAATFMGETDVPAFSIYVLVVLAPICIAGVLAVAIIDKRKVRR